MSGSEFVLFPMSQDYRIDPMVVRRLQVLATLTGRRFLGVDLPGVTMDYSRPDWTAPSSVPFRAALRAMSGDFRDLAIMQLDAARDVSGEELDDVRLLGESLGAQLVSSLAGARAVSPRSIELFEPVNPRPMSVPRLLHVARRLVTVEAKRKALYLDENFEEGWSDVTAFELTSPENSKIDRELKSWTRQGRHANLPALGLRRGLQRSLGQEPIREPITVWRASSSTVCPEVGCRELVTQLRARGTAAQMISLTQPPNSSTPVGHHVLSSLSRLAVFGRALAARWGDRGIGEDAGRGEP